MVEVTMYAVNAVGNPTSGSKQTIAKLSNSPTLDDVPVRALPSASASPPALAAGPVARGRCIPDAILFIDYDNLFFGCRDRLGRLFDVGEAIRLAGGRERVKEVRVYGDFGRLPLGAQRHLARHHVSCINMPSRRADGTVIKNASDMLITVDIVKTALQRHDINRIVLGAGDYDFLPGLVCARGEGFALTAIGVEGSMSAELRLLADEVLYLQGGPVLRQRAQVVTLGSSPQQVILSAI
jgi:uncharacterized LabA/DUF88 family protein